MKLAHLPPLGVFLLLAGVAISAHAQSPTPKSPAWIPPVPAEIPAPDFRPPGSGAAESGKPDSGAANFGAHGVGHAEHHSEYRHWHPPNNPNTSCCSNADCRPTRAYVDGDGQWHAWNGLRWLSVPRDRVLPTDYAHDGRTHLCEKEGFIYCFTPAEPKS